ncbi:hypothetical protein llap_19171 [Limosa lapponica baueri]|uniref:Uncharacterized protein n=1 Tax=Limosa lapponica baueri TaxID=1758121 RepID=A0A2I0T9R7_LIMLA|nr:hypothetical protein llap_19171 [Limosa lapponica baueri]
MLPCPSQELETSSSQQQRSMTGELGHAQNPLQPDEEVTGCSYLPVKRHLLLSILILALAVRSLTKGVFCLQHTGPCKEKCPEVFVGSIL